MGERCTSSSPGCKSCRVIRALSERYQNIIRSSSECYQTVIRILLEVYQSVIRALSERYQNIIRRLSEGYERFIRVLSERYRRVIRGLSERYLSVIIGLSVGYQQCWEPFQILLQTRVAVSDQLAIKTFSTSLLQSLKKTGTKVNLMNILLRYMSK